MILNSNLNYKLDVIYHNSQTSANDIYQAGIHRCSNWTDIPSDAPDSQGLLICYYYAGGLEIGWYRQVFITPHNDTTWVRNRSGSLGYSSWKKLAFSDVENVKDWSVILSTHDTGEYTVPDMSGYKEVLITWGYVYCISKTMLIPYSVFKTLTGGAGNKCFIDYPDVQVVYKSNTLIGIDNNNNDNLIRIFAR